MGLGAEREKGVEMGEAGMSVKAWAERHQLNLRSSEKFILSSSACAHPRSKGLWVNYAV